MAAPLISCQKITKTFGLVPVFRDLDFAVAEGDRIGIIGPNGAGKSTLLKIIASLEHADSGDVISRRGLRTAYVPQADHFPSGLSIRQVLEASIGSPNHASDLGLVEEMLGRAGFPDAGTPAAKLSGGWKKRLAIAAALIKKPDLLLLDEPTNHLDLEGIEWLEEILTSGQTAYAVISHDRYFLENACRKTIEISRVYPNGSFIVDGGYGEYMRRKAEFLEGQNSQLAGLANKLRYETEWLARGAQARSTKQQARIKSAHTLRQNVDDAKDRNRKLEIEMQFSASNRKTKRLIELDHVSKTMATKRLFTDLSFQLGPGMRLGLSGPNGSGKSTLLKILQKILPPDTGTVFQADQLKIVYFDQHREDIPGTMTVRRAMSEDSDTVRAGDRSVHVATWAKQFGFRHEQLETTVDRLSGGERARLLLARLLRQPADVLILDEPTNDLDIDTLEVLEESLCGFPGALVLVTHDRYLMDRVSTGILGLNGSGAHGFFADYSQFVDFIHASADNTPTAPIKKTTTTSTPAAPRRTTGKKLSYMEQREWDQMELSIMNAEEALASAQQTAADPSIASSSMRLQEACLAVDAAQNKVDTLYARWAELEAKLKEEP
jgi:ATP-binding cassette subfamily F protein uup